MQLSTNVSLPPPPPSSPPHTRLKRRAHFFVQGEEMLHAVTLGGEAGAAIEPVHGAVERLMGAAQVRRRLGES